MKGSVICTDKEKEATNKVWTDEAWDVPALVKQDKKILKRINWSFTGY